MNKIINPTFGSDPEFALVDSLKNPVSAIDLVPGSKSVPYPFHEKGYEIQVDNVMVELTFLPVNNEEDFVKSVIEGKKEMEKFIRDITDDNLFVLSTSSQIYSDEQLSDVFARKFGCEPSYCIYTGNESPRPTAEEVGNLRSCGFHIHVGCEGKLAINEIEQFIYYMDVFLGVPSIYIDGDTDRRKIYGNAGDFRFKYLRKSNITLMEYRTLGGNLSGSEQHVRWVYQQTLRAIEVYNSGDTSLNEYRDTVRTIIDTSNVEDALKLCKKFNIEIKVPQIVDENLIYELHSSIRNS